MVVAVLQTCMSQELCAGRNIITNLSVCVSIRHVCPQVITCFVPELVFDCLGIGQLYSNMPRHAYIIIMASSPMGIQDVLRMYQAQDIWRGARPAAPARRARSTPRRVWQLSTLATWRARPSTG